MANFLTRVFGSRNQRLLRQYGKTVNRINALEEGLQALETTTAMDAAIAGLKAKEAAQLSAALKDLLTAALAQREGRSFGICRTCRHHRKGPEGARCALLEVALQPEETGQICHEHEAAA